MFVRIPITFNLSLQTQKVKIKSELYPELNAQRYYLLVVRSRSLFIAHGGLKDFGWVTIKFLCSHHIIFMIPPH